MAKKKQKAQPKRATRPFIEWALTQHFRDQARVKGILPEAYQAILNGETEVRGDKRFNDNCKKCGREKIAFYARIAPSQGLDLKLVACRGCEEFITIYLNERTHGNTPIHPYQVAQGVTEYLLPACQRCGYRGRVTLEHKTQAQVDAQLVHECRGR